MFLVSAIVLGTTVGILSERHFNKLRQYNALLSNSFACADANDGSNCYTAFLEDEVDVDNKGFLIFADRNVEQTNATRIHRFGASLDRRYYFDAPLVWVHETTEALAIEVRKLNGVRQIVVWDSETPNSLETWSNWIPKANVVSPDAIGYTDWH